MSCDNTSHTTVPDEYKTIADWAKGGNVEKVEECLKNGSNPNLMHKEGWSLLHTACVHYSVPMVKLLLSYKANPNLRDSQNSTPLHYAASFGDVEICSILLDHGAELESQNDDLVAYVSRIPIYMGGGRTPLMMAVTKNEPEVVEFLLKKGADAYDIRDYDGRNAYELACRRVGTPIAPIICSEKETHTYIKEPVDIPNKITERTQSQTNNYIQKYRQLIKENYKPKHEKLYNITEEFLEPTFIAAIKDGSESAIKGLLEELSPGIYKFRMFTKEFCTLLLEELEHFESTATQQLKLAVRRPNSMNNYGIILDDIGFYETINSLMTKYISPFSGLLFEKDYGKQLDDHHCFMVRYKKGEDVDLALHVDDAEVTMNVCLGKEFTGGSLKFKGIKGEPSEKVEEYCLSHESGVSILHSGNHWHEALPIESGERINLILWCRSSQNKVSRRRR